MTGIVQKCDTSQTLPYSRTDLLDKQQIVTPERYGNVRKVTMACAIAWKGENYRKKGG
jgi:hypothetical protein